MSWKARFVARLCVLAAFGIACGSLAGGLRLNPPCNPGEVVPYISTPTNPSLPKRGPLVVCFPNDRPPTGEEREEFDKLREKYASKGWNLECFPSTDGSGNSVTKCVVRRSDGSVVFTGDPDMPFPPTGAPNSEPPKPDFVPTNPGGGNGNAQGGGAPSSKKQDEERDPWAGAGGTTCNPTVVATGAKVSDEVDLVVALPGQNFELRRSFSPATPMMGYTAGLGWNLSVDSYVHKADIVRNDDGSAHSTRGVAYIGVYAVPQRDTTVFHNDQTGGLAGEGTFYLPAGPGTTFIEEIDAFPIPTGVNGETTLMPVFRQVTFGGGATVYFDTKNLASPSLTPLQNEKYKRLHGMMAQQFDPFGNVWTYDYDETKEVRRNSTTGLLEEVTGPRLRHVFLHGTHIGDAGMRARLDFDWDWGYYDDPSTYIWRTDMLRGVYAVRFVQDSGSPRREVITDSVVYTYVQDLLDLAPGGNTEANRAAIRYLGTPRCLAMATRQTLLNAEVRGQQAGVDDVEIHSRFSQYRYALEPSGKLIGLKAIFYPEQFEYIAENAITNLQPNDSLGELAGIGNLVQAAAYEVLQLADSSSGDQIELAGDGLWTPKQLAGKWMEYDGSKKLKFQIVRSGCGCGSGMREDYGVVLAANSNQLTFPGGMAVWLPNYARIVHERVCNKDGEPAAGPPLRTRIYRNEQRVIHRVAEFPTDNGPSQAPSGWVMMEWAPFTTAEAVFEYQNNGELPASVKKVWVTGYEYDASNRTTARRMSSSMLSGVTSIPTPSLPIGAEFAVNSANVSADSLDFLVDPTLVTVPEIPGYSRVAYKASTGGISELSTYRTIASETANLDGQIQTWFGDTFGRMASLDIVERKTRAGTIEYVMEQKEFLPFSSWRPDLPTVQRRLTGVAASPTIESENSYQLEAFVGSDSVPFGPSSGGSTWRRIATVTTQTEGDGTEENGSSNSIGNVNEVFSIQGFSTVGSMVWERQTSGRLDARFHDETTGAEVMRVNHVGLLFAIDGKPNIRTTGPHGRALNFNAMKLNFNNATESLIKASIVDIMGRERRRIVNIPNSWSAGEETLLLAPGGHVTDTRYGLDVGFARWYPEASPDRWKSYVETQSGGFFASPTSTSFFQPPSPASAVWLGPISRTYLDSAMNAVCEETRESNHIVSSGEVLSRTEYSLDLAGRVSTTRKWWFAFSQGAAGNKFFTSRVERDALGRVRKAVDENGGVTETDYDAKDRAIEIRTGASESAMGSSATFQTSRMLYDYSGASTIKGGDGLLNFTVQSLGVGQPERVRRTLYDNLYRPVADVAVESLAAAQTPVGPWKLSVTDLAGRTIESGSASSELSVSAVGTRLGMIASALTNGLDGLAHLNSHEKTRYSAHRGLAYRSESAIVPGNWSAGVLRTDRWFDAAGNVLTLRPPASPMILYLRDVHDRVLWEASSWPALTATDLNTALAPSIPAFQRKGYSYHSGTSLVSLTKTTSSSPDTSLPQISSYVGSVYDPAGRPIATVNYGHGLHAINTQSDPTIDQASQPLNTGATAPAAIPMPLSLSTSWAINSYGTAAPEVPSTFLSANPGVVITRQSYNAWGLPQDSIDASGRITRTLYDSLGRVVGSIENMGERTAAGSYHYIFPEWFEASGGEPGHWGVNWSSFSSVTLGADSCRVTTSVLDGLGNTVLRVAFQRGETVAKQFSRFIYNIGDTAGSFSTAGYGSSNLLYEIRYPDPVTGLPSMADDQRIRYRYNQAGEQTAVIDQNGTTRLFARDSQGRLLTDSVQLPLASGSAVDTSAATTRNTYDTSGRVLTTEMLNASNATLNKVTYEYDELGGVKALKQIAGYVGGGGGGALGEERIVRYDLKSYPWLASPSGVGGVYQNNWRGMMGVSYPDPTPGSTSDDTELRYYPDADRVSELSSAATDAHHRFAIVQPKMPALRHAGAFAPTSGTSFTPTTANPSGVKLVANVHRLGMGKTASMSLDVPQVHLDRVRSMTGKTKEGVYGGWDRFGRLKQQVWALTPTPAPTAANATPASGAGSQGWMQDTSSSPTYPEVRPVYQHAYSYSADSDRMSDDDLRPTYGGGSGQTAAAPDRKYSYDNLRRLIKEENGKFTWSNGSQSFTSGAGSKAWSLDLLGNWKSVATDTDGNGTFGTSETSTRTHDAQNQLVSLGATSAGGSEGSGTAEYIRAYDKNGNLITETKAGDSKPTRRFIYDAWNRLVRVERGLGGVGVGAVEPTPVATYTYNALNWRVTERVRWPGDAELSGGGGYTRTRVFFFSSDWQVLDALEDRHAPTASTGISTFTPDSETQFVWGVRDKDELLEVRTRALTNSSGTVITPVTPWSDNAVNTLYSLSDAQMSVAGYVNSSGRMREARVYDSYGRMTRALPGDFNADGVCDDADFQVFNTSYDLMLCNAAGMPGSNAGPNGGGYAPTWGCVADLNGDWLVDETDFGIFAASYGQLLPELDTLVSGNASAGAVEWGPGWNGYWFDPATGLWLSRNRWYDPEAGRWITRDPAGYVDGLSLYLYVKGNPLLFRDPSGLAQAWYQDLWDAAKYTVGGNPAGTENYQSVGAAAAEGAAGGMSHQVNSASFGLSDSAGLTSSDSYQGDEYAVSKVTGAIARDALIGAATAGAGNAIAAAATTGQAVSMTTQVVSVAGRAYSAATGAISVVEGGQNIADGNYVTGALQIAGGTGGVAAGFSTPKIAPPRLSAPATTGRTNSELIQAVANRANAAIPGSGSRVGTLKHSYADRMLTRYQRMFGDRGLATEKSFKNGGQVKYGTKDSVRLDVYDKNANAAYDYKFGDATLSARRSAQIQQQMPAGGNVCEVKPR